MKKLTEQLENLLERSSADLSPTGLRLEAGVYDLAHHRWAVGSCPDAPVGFGEDGYVLVLFGRQHLPPTAPDGTPGALEIIGDVQEWAIDELGYGWPELCDENILPAATCSSTSCSRCCQRWVRNQR